MHILLFFLSCLIHITTIECMESVVNKQFQDLNIFEVDLYQTLSYPSNVTQKSQFYVHIFSKTADEKEYPVCVHYPPTTDKHRLLPLMQIGGKESKNDGYLMILYTDSIKLTTPPHPLLTHYWNYRDSHFGYCNEAFIKQFKDASTNIKNETVAHAPERFTEVTEKLTLLFKQLETVNQVLASIDTAEHSCKEYFTNQQKADIISSAECFLRIWMETEGIRCGLTKEQNKEESISQQMFKDIFDACNKENHITHPALHTLVKNELTSISPQNKPLFSPDDQNEGHPHSPAPSKRTLLLLTGSLLCVCIGLYYYITVHYTP